jgi:ATP-dependent DNA ligase
MTIEPFAPMLAARGEPFESAEYLFEVKWDGVRALAARDTGGWRLWGRDLADYRDRYPELDFLARLPEGTALDGELVLFEGELPDLDALLARHALRQPAMIRHLSGSRPVCYVVFDALYERGRPLFGEPLSRRRAVLAEVVDRLAEPRLAVSTGVVGAGRRFFEEAVAGGQEGVVAKHLAGGYASGRRTAAWRKVKPARSLPCVAVGFVPGACGVRRLLVAAPREGRLRYVATLRSGWSAAEASRLAALLSCRGRARPLVACPHPAAWVEPAVYCLVRYLDWTRHGRLRGASFGRLLEAPAAAGGEVTP